MRVLVQFSVVIALAQRISVSGQDTLETRYGLTFSPTTVSASRFNSSGAIEITRLSAGRGYEEYYRDAIRRIAISTQDPVDNEAYYRSEAHKYAISVLRKAVTRVTASLSGQLGHEPDYAAVFMPSVFDIRAQVAAQEAVFPDGGDEKGIINYGQILKVACEGLGFLERKHIGRTIEECNDDDGPETMILVLEYEKDYLHAGLVQIFWEWELFPVNREATCVECGEQSREQIGDQAYTQRVQNFLDDLIDQTLHGHYHHERNDIR